MPFGGAACAFGIGGGRRPFPGSRLHHEATFLVQTPKKLGISTLSAATSASQASCGQEMNLGLTLRAVELTS